MVEDEPEISLLCSKILTSKMIKVDIAYDGEMGEEMLEKKDYTLCLIDLGTLMKKDKQLCRYMNEKYPKLLKGAVFTAEGVVAGDKRNSRQSITAGGQSLTCPPKRIQYQC